jgi:hypothetical protein
MRLDDQHHYRVVVVVAPAIAGHLVSTSAAEPRCCVAEAVVSRLADNPEQLDFGR